jgi:hypothetical protein
MDASAGWKVHYLESAARVVVGILGALLVTLAIRLMNAARQRNFSIPLAVQW